MVCLMLEGRCFGRMAWLSVQLSMALALVLSGCTASYHIQQAEEQVRAGAYEPALTALKTRQQAHPEAAEYRSALVRLTNDSLDALVREAERARRLGKAEEALALYQRALVLDETNARATEGLRLVEQSRRHALWLARAEEAAKGGNASLALHYAGLILAEDPAHAQAVSLKRALSQQKHEAERAPLQIRAKLSRPISIELRQASLKHVLKLLSETGKINLILDADVKGDTPVTIYARDSRLEETLEFLLTSYELDKKVLNDNTLLIYPNTPEKRARYADLFTRSFSLAHANPQKVADLLKAIVKPADLYVDEKGRTLVIRDTQDVLGAAEKLIALHDVAPAEVILDVEIMEVSSDVLYNLGVQYPSQLGLSVLGQDNKAGVLRWNEISGLNSSALRVAVGDPLAVLNLKNTVGKGNILAKPQIRVRNRETAKILIGDKVPVITTSINQTSGFQSESVSYLDVGLKLEVAPEIFPSNEVAIKVALEVSNVAKEITGSSGLRAYQIGTRNADTTLQLRDGETQVLAGLIKDEEIKSASRLPGLGAIPILGKLFSSENNNRRKSELVLLITPHVVRNAGYPDLHEGEFYSGTKDRLALAPPRLGPQARYDTEPGSALLKGRTSESSAPTGAVPQAEPSVAPVATASQAVPAADADVRLKLIAPPVASAGQTVTVSVALDASYLRKLVFRLVPNSPQAKVQGVMPMLSGATVTHRIDGNAVEFTVTQTSDAARSSDMVASVQLQMAGTGNVQVMLEPVEALDKNGNALTVSGEAQQIEFGAAVAPAVPWQPPAEGEPAWPRGGPVEAAPVAP